MRCQCTWEPRQTNHTATDQPNHDRPTTPRQTNQTTTDQPHHDRPTTPRHSGRHGARQGAEEHNFSVFFDHHGPTAPRTVYAVPLFATFLSRIWLVDPEVLAAMDYVNWCGLVAAEKSRLHAW